MVFSVIDLTLLCLQIYALSYSMTTLKIYFVPDIFAWNSPTVPVHLLTMNTVSVMRGNNHIQSTVVFIYYYCLQYTVQLYTVQTKIYCKIHQEILIQIYFYFSPDSGDLKRLLHETEFTRFFRPLLFWNQALNQLVYMASASLLR